LTVENRGLAENNKVLKGQVTLLQEALLASKAEWQGMKYVEKIREDSAVEIREEMNSKTSKGEGKTIEQADTHGTK
jgi:hypothetical protein